MKLYDGRRRVLWRCRIDYGSLKVGWKIVVDEVNVVKEVVRSCVFDRDNVYVFVGMVDGEGKRVD